jgi:hypothetical protein
LPRSIAWHPLKPHQEYQLSSLWSLLIWGNRIPQCKNAILFYLPLCYVSVPSGPLRNSPAWASNSSYTLFQKCLRVLRGDFADRSIKSFLTSRNSVSQSASPVSVARHGCRQHTPE